MNSSRALSLAGWLCMAAAVLGAADEAVSPSPRGRGQGEGRSTGVPPVHPLWDGHETVAQYAKRVNLPATQTLDLGNGVALELVLIPAGKFIVGFSPEPKSFHEGAFPGRIIVGQAILAAGGGILLVLVGFSILRAIRERRSFQYSLRRFIGMIVAAGLCVLGSTHWWYSQRSLAKARMEYETALVNYMFRQPSEMTITTPFYMGKCEVTQEQNQQIMGANPSHFKRPNLPVEMVCWDDAQEFCRKVSERTASVSPAPTEAGGRPAVRLPTAVEWEYACRAGTTTTYYSGNKESDLAPVAWYGANSGGSTHPVGHKEANAWGLYDMHGNLDEWCEDWIKDISIKQKAGHLVPRYIRGGSWQTGPMDCRSDSWFWIPSGTRDMRLGFRVVLAGQP